MKDKTLGFFLSSLIPHLECGFWRVVKRIKNLHSIIPYES
jgi:hypothetical protein